MSDDKTNPTTGETNGGHDAFRQQAEKPQMGLLAEFWDFFLHNKKWWLTPIILVLLLVAMLLVMGGTVGPFIYTLF